VMKKGERGMRRTPETTCEQKRSVSLRRAEGGGKYAH
jgi:hypothetical protein